MADLIRKYSVPVIFTIILIVMVTVYRAINVQIQRTPTLTGVTRTTSTGEKGSRPDNSQQLSGTNAPTKLAVTPTGESTRASVSTSIHATATETPVPTDTSTPTNSPTPTYTSTPTRTPTSTPAKTPTPIRTPTPTPRPPSIELLVDELTVRRGPGRVFPVLYVVHKGGFLIVQSKNLDFDKDPWFLIKVRQDGIEEWITGDPRYVTWYNIDSLSSRRGPAPPVDPHFRADRTSLTAGECTHLRWDVEGVYGVYLDGVGKVGHYVQLVCPKATHTYVLTIHQRDERWIEHPLTIYVSGQVTARMFVIEHHGCVGHDSQLGVVKGQVFDKHGNIIQGAAIKIAIDGGAWNDPANPARTNEDGWYEWWLGVGQRISFLQLDIQGVPAQFGPKSFEVETRAGCFQYVDFREQ